MSEERYQVRPSFHEIYMNLAKDISRRSTCARLQVGCVIVTPDFRKVLAVGYNGNVTGGKNECDRFGEQAVGNCGCLHAEENAVINCDVPRNMLKFVYCTNLPCEMCAKRLIQLGGVQRVYYWHGYRKMQGLALLDKHSIITGHLNETYDVAWSIEQSRAELDAFLKAEGEALAP